MATIQIADKPTVDAIKALLESSGGVKGYPNVNYGVLQSKGINPELSVTGKGKITFTPGGFTEPIRITIDGVDTGTNIIQQAHVYTYTFEHSLKLKTEADKNTIGNIPYIIQLAD